MKLGQSFNFSLKSEKGAPPKAKPKRSPSYLRRQLRRREDFLKKRSGSSLENVDAAPRHTQPVQNEEAAVDNSCQLDLCPRPVDPRKSEGSVDSEQKTTMRSSSGHLTAQQLQSLSLFPTVTVASVVKTGFEKKRKAADLRRGCGRMRRLPSTPLVSG